MSTSIFLSHSSADKPFARRLALDLDAHGIKCWLDEAEIKVGESLIERIRGGIDSVEFVAVIISPDSVKSAWVRKEVEIAMNLEILGRKIKVLPLMYRECDPPDFLIGKKYADFTSEEKYESAFKSLVESVGVVYRKSVIHNLPNVTHIGRAIDKAWGAGLPILCRPFHRPFQYMGMSVDSAAKAVSGTPNSVGNIIVDTDECHMCLEAEGNFVNYVDIELKRTAPHYQNQEFDSEPILGALSINLAELELVQKTIRYHHYSDHRRKLKVSVSCVYDGGPLTVGFSAKYYGK